jgi:hypothetical protein
MTKVREKEALLGWMVCVCVRAQRERRDEGTCTTTTLTYLDREKPSRSPTLVIDIIARYDELAKRS